MSEFTDRLQKIELLKENIMSAPSEPGIYVFWNKDKIPHYVGKSVSLKNRLTSYISGAVEGKTREMVRESSYFSFVRVNSELESLLLEAKLIKLLMPKYNIELKDDKHPLYIKITNEKYPRILTARRTEANSFIAFYGPFPSSYIVKRFLKKIRRIFPFSDHVIGKRPCLYSQIGLCNPCPNLIDTLPEDQNKKERNKYLKNVKLIKKILDGNIDKVYIYFKRKMEEHSKVGDFEKAIIMREQIRSLEYVSQSVTSPSEFLKNPNLLHDIRNMEKTDLQNLLEPFFGARNYSRIECYDIAHLAGTSPTASMVTFINGEPEKNLYRRFKVKKAKGGDDYNSLHEVAVRRIKHLKDWGQPDLMIIDGGRGQVGIFLEVFKKQEVPIVGLAKRFETIVVPHEGAFFEKRLKGKVLNLFQRIRNEAHRFARKYHHLLVEREFTPN